MRFDTYTKGVLTVIAIALCALVAQNSIQETKAQERGLQKVQICDETDCMRLSKVRKRAPVQGYFLTFALPTFAETEER